MNKQKVAWFYYLHFHPTGSRWKLLIRLGSLTVGTIGLISGICLLLNHHPFGALACYIGAGNYLAYLIFNTKRLYQKVKDKALDFLN